MIRKSLLTIISLSLFLGSSVYSMEHDDNINFETRDGKIVSCPRKLCFFSTVIKNVIEDIPGGEESDDFIPLPNIERRDWGLLYPLLKFIRDDKVQEIRGSLHEQYALHDLVKLLHASNFLDVRKKVHVEGEIVLLELVTEAIAERLLSPQKLSNFLNDKEFLEKLGLDCGELLPELSVLLAQKVIAHKPGCREKLLQCCPVPQKALEGHTRIVTSASFNQSGDRVVTASLDGTVRIWNVETGGCLNVLNKHEFYVVSAAFNQLGVKIAKAPCSKTVRIWNVETGQCLKVLRGHTNWVVSTAFNQSGDKVVTASADKTARIWDLGKLLLLERYLERGLYLEQALLLVCWNEAQSDGNPLDLRDNAYLQSVFESIDDENIKNIVKSDVILPSRIVQAIKDSGNVLVGAGVCLTGWAFWEFLKK